MASTENNSEEVLSLEDYEKSIYQGIDNTPIDILDKMIKSGKIDNEYKFDLVMIKTSLISENTKKYSIKRTILESDQKNYFQKIKQDFPKLSKDNYQKKLGSKHLVLAWELYDSINQKYTEIYEMEQKIKKGLGEVDQFKKTIRQNKNEIVNLTIKMDGLIDLGWEHRYEYKILLHICTLLPKFRIEVDKLIRDNAGTKLADTFWAVPNPFYDQLNDQIRACFDKYILALIQFMKQTYIEWLCDPLFVPTTSDEIKQDFEAYKIKQRELIEIEGEYIEYRVNQKNKVFPNPRPTSPPPQFTIISHLYGNLFPDLDKMWEKLTIEDLNPILDSLNGVEIDNIVGGRIVYKPKLLIKKTYVAKEKKKEEADEEEIGIDKKAELYGKKQKYVWWADDVLPEKKLYTGDLEYKSFRKRVKLGDEEYYVNIDVKDSMLLHDISDNFKVTIGSSNYQGIDALFKLSYKKFYNIAGDKETQESYIKMFQTPLERQLDDLEFRVKSVFEYFDIEKTPLENIKPYSKKSTIEKIENDIQQIKDTNWMEIYEWKEEDKKEMVDKNTTRINNLEQEAIRLRQKMEEINTLRQIKESDTDFETVSELVRLEKIPQEIITKMVSNPKENYQITKEQSNLGIKEYGLLKDYVINQFGKIDRNQIISDENSAIFDSIFESVQFIVKNPIKIEFHDKFLSDNEQLKNIYVILNDYKGNQKLRGVPRILKSFSEEDRSNILKMTKLYNIINKFINDYVKRSEFKVGQTHTLTKIQSI